MCFEFHSIWDFIKKSFRLSLLIFHCFSQALDLTVQLMEMGEEALIEAAAKYAYGALGR